MAMSVPRRSPQQILVSRLADPAFHGPHCRAVRLIETHISFVILTGTFAFKIKKAVALGFLDFRRLSSRRFFCQEEIRLNRRLAPSIYLEVVAITGTPETPRLGGDGQAIEYAVRMREFPQHALLSAVVARGALTVDHVDRLAAAIAAFHHAARPAFPHTRFGTPSDVLALARENFDDLAPRVESPVLQRILSSLRDWTEHEQTRLAAILDARRHHGFVRECHGDLHLGNIALVGNVPTAFDCIEFNERMRWSDVMSDVAFLTMDLEANGRVDLADRFLNRYLEDSGDYEGLALLPFFVVYRAMVRAKVAMLQAAQHADPAARAAQVASAARFMRRAVRTARRPAPALVVTHGFSGSGKTSVARALSARVQGIHIRADVERRRLFGVDKLARTGATLAAGIYSAEATRRTYDRLAVLARAVWTAGYVPIVDAAFLTRRQRERFRSIAAAAGIPFVILDCTAPVPTLLDRISARSARADDASEADADVLVHQMETADALDADEHRFVVPCEMGGVPPGALPPGLVDEVRRRMLAPAVTRAPSPPGRSPAG